MYPLLLLLPQNQNRWLLTVQFGSTFTSHRFTYFLFLNCLTGFFEDAKSDFQQALTLNPGFEDAKASLQQTILDQQHKLERGYWKDHKLTACFVYPGLLWLKRRRRHVDPVTLNFSHYLTWRWTMKMILKVKLQLNKRSIHSTGSGMKLLPL